MSAARYRHGLGRAAQPGDVVLTVLDRYAVVDSIDPQGFAQLRPVRLALGPEPLPTLRPDDRSPRFVPHLRLVGACPDPW